MSKKLITFNADDKEIKILEIIKQTEKKSIIDIFRLLISEGYLRRGIIAGFVNEFERGKNEQRK